MRCEPIAPDHLTDTQRRLDEAVRGVVAARAGGTTPVTRPDGALIGPYPAMLAHPVLGTGLWAAIEPVMRPVALPPAVREVVILVVGARFQARYELYAHGPIAERVGIDPADVRALVAGQHPPGLDDDQLLAHDAAASLCAPGPLPQALHRACTEVFGQDGLAELVHLVGIYAAVCVLLNAHDVPVPKNN